MEDKTVNDVWNEFTEDQKTFVKFMVKKSNRRKRSSHSVS